MNRFILRVLATVLPMALVIGGLTVAPAEKSFAAEDIVVQTVEAPFDKVVVNLKRAFTSQKLVIVKAVPYQQMLGMVGIKAEKMMGFEVFHPRFGKPMYAADPASFKEVPLRILVRETRRGVILEYRKPSVIFAPYPRLAKLGKQLDSVLASVMKSAME
ncbi:MAG: hypothetical protein BMS9Abin01_1646 [Gammaproteobacteria bacterium]|nr:MAG: hypothetical protein BMS9Abin01_1646 [Gammaproteobacteria bacterium]